MMSIPVVMVVSVYVIGMRVVVVVVMEVGIVHGVVWRFLRRWTGRVWRRRRLAVIDRHDLTSHRTLAGTHFSPRGTAPHCVFAFSAALAAAATAVTLFFPKG